MKFVALTLGFVLSGNLALAETWHFSDILKKSESVNKQGLSSFLSELSLEPAKDPSTGKDVFKVVKVASGSVSEKIGITAGDLLVEDESKPVNGMELKQTLKTAPSTTSKTK